VREGYKAEHLAIGNRLRGLLAEFGIVVPNRDAALHRVLGDLDAYAELPGEFKELLRSLTEHWVQLRAAMAACDARIDRHARQDDRCLRLRAVVGVGPLTADAMVASIGNAREFKNGRQLAAWLGLVPTQHSSGGHARLGAISCRGDGYLRTLLIQGARSSLERAKRVGLDKATPEQIWIRSLACRMPFGKIIVAIANKHARQLWAMLAHDVDYDPHAHVHHPLHQQASV
jgi:transposase